MNNTRWLLLAAAGICTASSARADDWPTVQHDAGRSGYSADSVRAPYRLQWVREFPGETMATRVEPIVAGGRVFAGTYSGTLYALDRKTGAVLWRHAGGAPVLHSPAVLGTTVFYATAGHSGSLFALDVETGKERWRFRGGSGGYAASPLVAGGTVFLGDRGGSFHAVDTRTGRERFRLKTGGPIRNTAALAGDRVLFASDDMRAYAVDARTGAVKWTSAPLFGQSFRDYHPVVVGRTVVLRSVLVEETNDDLNGGTSFLQRQASVPGGWKELDAFLKSARSRGTPEQVRSEQEAIRKRLEENPYRRTCFVLDLETGRETTLPVVLYAAGNGGCGIPPVLMRDGRALVFYRTVYGHWSHGVKPAVGLGFLDPLAGWVEPVRHTRGTQPPWNTFWGTSDESTRLSVGGNLVYLCHQGTLAGYDLRTGDLFPIHGNRDTWGGLLAPIWAANEWHGPARGACAISDDQLFWITGSRVLAIRGGGARERVPAKPLPQAETRPHRGSGRPSLPAPVSPEAALDLDRSPHVRGIPAGATRRLRERLAAEVRELRSGWPWAPQYLQLGIGSRDFTFAHASETVQALAMSIPHLPGAEAQWARTQARMWLDRCLEPGGLPLDAGRRRELFAVPPHDLKWARQPGWPPMSHLHAVWLYGERTGDWDAVRSIYPRAAGLWREYQQKPFVVNGRPESLYRNRTLAGLIAYYRLTRKFSGARDAEPVQAECRRLFGEILADYRAKAARVESTLLQQTSQGDVSRNQARFLYLDLRNHLSKLALFMDLTPEIAKALKRAAPAETESLRRAIEVWMPAYYLAYEERQVHYGENFIEPPDSMHGVLLAHALLWDASPESIEIHTDLPWCRGDLYHLEKLTIAIERRGRQEGRRVVGSSSAVEDADRALAAIRRR